MAAFYRTINIFYKHCNLLFIGLCFISICDSLKAQTPKLDSLFSQLNQQHSSQKKLEIILNICAKNYSLSNSNLLKYIQLGENLSPPGSPEYFRVKTMRSIYLSRAAHFDESLHLLDSLLKIIPEGKKYTDVRLRIINSKITTLIRKGNSKEAIENTFLLLQEAEKGRDTLRVLSAYAVMGWANMELGNFNDAIRWINKGINYTTDTNKLYEASFLFSNIASCYNNIEKDDSAFYYINLALKCTRKDENLTGIANALNIRADMYMKQKNFAAAEHDMKEALQMREHIGDVMFVVSDMAQLSSFYASINETEKGIDIAQKGIAIAKEKKNFSKLIFLYSALAENYQIANKKDEYANTLLTIINLKDTLYQQNSERAIADMEAKYEVAKKEKIIIQQNLSLTKRNYLLFGSLTFFVMIVIFTFLVFNQYQQKQKSMAMVAISEAKEDERKRIAAELHDNIGTQLSFISRKIEFVKSSNNNSVVEKADYLDEIHNSARKTISDLRETIWALKKEKINLRDLTDRLKVFTQQQLGDHPEIELIISENIESEISFSSIDSLNIFRICQEAINNVIFHSNAAQIHLSFSSDKNHSWKIIVADNGKGFDTNQQFENHFGLENMQQRASQVKAKIAIASVPNKGTTISLYKS